MKSLIFFLCSFFILGSNSINNEMPADTQYIDLSGTWNISGNTTYGYLNHHVEIMDYDDRITFSEVDSWGNSKSRTVQQYSKSSSQVIIKIRGNDGMGAYTSLYKLRIIDEDQLKGSYTMNLGSMGALPGTVIKGNVTFSRQ